MVKIRWNPQHDQVILENDSGHIEVDGSDLGRLEAWLDAQVRLESWLEEEA